MKKICIILGIFSLIIGNNLYTAELNSHKTHIPYTDLPENVDDLLSILEGQKKYYYNIFPSTICVYGQLGIGKTDIIHKICNELIRYFFIKQLNDVIKDNQGNIDHIFETPKTIYYLEASHQKLTTSSLLHLVKCFNACNAKLRNSSIFFLELSETPPQELRSYFNSYIKISKPSEKETQTIIETYISTFLKGKHQKELCSLLMNNKKLYTSKLSRPQLIGVIKIAQQLYKKDHTNQDIVHKALKLVYPFSIKSSSKPSELSYFN